MTNEENALFSFQKHALSNMKSAFKWFSFVMFCFITAVAVAQVPENTTVNSNDDFPDFTKLGGDKKTNPPATTTQPQNKPTTGTTSPNSSTPAAGTTGGGAPQKIEPAENKGDVPADVDAPLDGIVERKTILEKEILPWEPVRESDVMWSKRVWRVIDVREKMNLPFIYPEEPFFSILMKGVQDSSLRAFKTDNDKFWYKMSAQEVQTIGSRVDTITQVDPITYETKIRVVISKINPEDIKRYRIKEEWFFDKQYSTMKVRILGIAPLRDVTDDAGNFLFEQALFWVRYPDCREVFGRHRVFIDGNDSNPMSWEDLFELRRFSSYVSKESNVHNRRLQDYMQGIDILLEGEKIKQEIFNYEHDLWSY
jgi:gliding motility associated protien GldN